MLEPGVGLGDREHDLEAPLARRGSQVSRCSSVPNSVIISAEIAAETTRSSSGVPGRRDLLADQRELGQPSAATAVLPRGCSRR